MADSLGLGLIGSPRSRIAAMMHAAIRSAPASFRLSSSAMPITIGEYKTKDQDGCGGVTSAAQSDTEAAKSPYKARTQWECPGTRSLSIDKKS